MTEAEFAQALAKAERDLVALVLTREMEAAGARYRLRRLRRQIEANERKLEKLRRAKASRASAKR